MKIVEHEYTIEPAHDILLESWNPQHAYDYALNYKKIVSQYFAREWVCLLNLQHLGQLVSDPSQLEIFRALNAWSYIKGMKALVVMANIQNRHPLHNQFVEIFNDHQPYEKAFFYNDAELGDWMTAHGLASPPLQQSNGLH